MSYPSESPRTGQGDAYELPYDGPSSEAVVAAVAESTGQSPLEMAPLAGILDPDALNALFGPRDDPSVTVSFEYSGRNVTVTPEYVRVEE